MKEINETFDRAFENYPLESGFLLIGIGICLLILRLQKKNTFKMKDYSYFEWRVLLGSWLLIIMIFLLGLSLIIKNI